MEQTGKEPSGIILNKRLLHNLALPLCLILPISILYLLYPDSFQITFGTGRASYLVFLWILCLEFAIYWRKLSPIQHQKLKLPTIIALVLSLTIPTAYVLAISYTGLNQSIVELGRLLGVPTGSIFDSAFVEQHWPVSFELALFSVCFSLSALILYGKEGLSKLAVAFFFLWAVTVFNMTDTFFPVGRIWILQILVPFTVNSSASVLRLMGYGASTTEFSNPIYGFGTALAVFKDGSVFSVVVFWPSAGIHSMIIYTLTILLFIKSASISIKQKAIVFVVGAVGTFIANVLRIVTISRIGLENGALAAQHFHDYYGEFFFISWMIIFLTIVALGPRMMQRLIKRVQSARIGRKRSSAGNITT